MSRRAKRVAASFVALGLVAGGTTAGASPASAVPFGGFTTIAIATPLKLELFEPAIPVPTEPQAEFDISYTRVLGSSGPATRARASAMWPGDAVGEGLKTFGEQLGLPPEVFAGGYPTQVNATFPGETNQQSQEYFPGMIGRVEAGENRTVAKAAYSNNDVSDGDAGDGEAGSGSPLDAINELLGPSSGPADSPLGTLGLLVDFDGMTSVSSSDYDTETVTATATSRIGKLRLLGGIITLKGVNVVSKVTSSLDGGAKTAQTVDIGSMDIAGQKFSYGPNGFTAAGNNTPVPGFPAEAEDLLKMLGVSIEVPKPEVTAESSFGSVSAVAARITLDTKPLRKNLPALPLDDIVNGLPELPGQASLLKGLLLSLNTMAPTVVLHVGFAEASAETIAAPEFGAGGGGPGVITPESALPDANLAPVLDEVVPLVDDVATENQEAVPVAKGLPPLRSLPMLLLLGGLALAAGVGWYLRYAGLLLFGGSSACAFGLKVGIPDLRKA